MNVSQCLELVTGSYAGNPSEPASALAKWLAIVAAFADTEIGPNALDGATSGVDAGGGGVRLQTSGSLRK